MPTAYSIENASQQEKFKHPNLTQRHQIHSRPRLNWRTARFYDPSLGRKWVAACRDLCALFDLLASFGGKSGKIFPAISTLSYKLGWCRRRVFKRLKQLEHLGLVSRGGFTAEHGTRYRFIHPEKFEKRRLPRLPRDRKRIRFNGESRAPGTGESCTPAPGESRTQVLRKAVCDVSSALDVDSVGGCSRAVTRAVGSPRGERAPAAPNPTPHASATNGAGPDDPAGREAAACGESIVNDENETRRELAIVDSAIQKLLAARRAIPYSSLQLSSLLKRRRSRRRQLLAKLRESAF